METQEDMRLLGGPKLHRERSDISTWDWAESGWDEEVCGLFVWKLRLPLALRPPPAPARALYSLPSHCARMTQKECKVLSPRSSYLLLQIPRV